MKRITALALALILVFALAACGGSSGGAKPGVYKATAMVQDGQDVSDQLAMLESLGMEIDLVLNEDGTGYLDMYGQHLDLTWDDSNLTVDGEAEPYTMDGENLILKEGNTSLTFTLKK